MKLKALITTFVLGSSTVASAGTFTVSASAKVSLGVHTTAPASRYFSRTRVVRYHHTLESVDPCLTSAPAATPVWSGPFYDPHNTIVGATASQYTGWMGTSAIKAPQAYNRWSTQDWFDLTEATRIDQAREYFNVGADNGLFRSIKLQNLGGRASQIEQVTILFVDGLGRSNAQKVVLNQRLDQNRSEITIDLDGDYRAIGGIIVYGSTEAGAAYKIVAK